MLSVFLSVYLSSDKLAKTYIKNKIVLFSSLNLLSVTMIAQKGRWCL